jgi:hypothetical protein
MRFGNISVHGLGRMNNLLKVHTRACSTAIESGGPGSRSLSALICFWEAVQCQGLFWGHAGARDCRSRGGRVTS